MSTARLAFWMESQLRQVSMQSFTNLLLVRHAVSDIDRDRPRTAWPLSDRGVSQAGQLAKALRDTHIDAVYSSPYARALQTVLPLAEQRGLNTIEDPGLGERIVSDGYVDDWDGVMAQSWADFDFALHGGESNRQCQTRMLATMHRLAERHLGATIALGTHGIVIALALKTFTPFAFETWQAMPEPALYGVQWSAQTRTFSEYSEHPQFVNVDDNAVRA